MTQMSEFITRKELIAWMGWAPSTIWRKVKEGCFPCYRLGRRDVRFKPDEIRYYIEGKREGGFNS